MNKIKFVRQKIAIIFRRSFQRLLRLVPRKNIVNSKSILISPQELRTSDITIAKDILAGRLTFAGRHMEAGQASIFDVQPPTYAFAEELHGFGWLRHIRAYDNPAAHQSTRALVADWMDLYGRVNTGFAMQPNVLARRIISWISQAPVLLDGAEIDFYDQFMRSLNSQAGILWRELKLGIQAQAYLPARIALCYYALCTDASPKLLNFAEAQLLSALEAEILPDGGHVSRNPQILLDIVLDLLPLQQVFSARDRIVPRQIPEVIARMLAMLRLLRHSDGAIATFNGMSATENGLMARILPYLNNSDTLAGDASYSGYQRFVSGNSVLIVDAGRPPVMQHSSKAHAGCLSFEFSTSGGRIFINCGAAQSGSDQLRQLARTSAAHSVLILNDMSSCRFAKTAKEKKYFGNEIISGSTELTYGRQLAENGEMLITRHNGYVDRFGVVYQRSLWLGDNGLRLEGQEALFSVERTKRRFWFSKEKPRKAIPSEDLPFALRFHLHPSVEAIFDQSQNSVKLRLSNGEFWLFTASGLRIDVEDSFYLATQQGQQKTLQLVVSGLAQPGMMFDWVLECI